MIYPIVKLGDPVLEKHPQPVTVFDEELKKLVDDMFESMYAAHGVGLAAPQIGISKRLAVIDVTPQGLKVVETDLGEYILQINDYEPPSHIIGPALHKSKEEVADLFTDIDGRPYKESFGMASSRAVRTRTASSGGRARGWATGA